MQTNDRLIRIQQHASEILALLRHTALQPDPDTAASIHDRAQLIERDTALLASDFMPTRGNA